MAKVTKNYYFVFRENTNTPYRIHDTYVHINTDLMPMYREFTAEQLAFYQEHPTASVLEIWNCQLTPPYVPPTPDVQEYAADKVRELKAACYGSVSVTSLEYAMALDKIENPASIACYYNLTKAIQVRDDFRSQSKHAMQVLDTYKPQIESAQTIEAVDEIYQQAIEEL